MAEAFRQGMGVANAAKYIKATKTLKDPSKVKAEILFKHEKGKAQSSISEKPAAVKSYNVLDASKPDTVALTTESGMPYYVKKVPDAKKTWDDGHFPRGRKVETVLENNLGPTFPTVDKMCWDSGTVTSIKSRDLNTKTLQNPTRLEYVIRKDINSIAQFKEGRLGEQRIEAYQIKAKALEIAIPHLGNPDQQNILHNMFKYGQEVGVEVKIIMYKE